jgi:hypothetical protein
MSRERQAESECDLKKQSQFSAARIGANSFVKGDYANGPGCGVEKNEANQSQSPGFGRKY